MNKFDDYRKIGEAALSASGLDPNNLSQYQDRPNEWFNTIQNKVIAQYLLETLSYENPYTPHFKRVAIEMGEGVEVLMMNPYDSRDYDKKKYVPDGTEIKDDIKTQVIWTNERKVFEYTLSRPQLMAAFSSIERLGAFITEYVRQLQQSIEIFLWEKISNDLSGITNVITLPKGTTDEDAYLQILTTSNTMMNPSKDFNVDGQKWKLNASPKNKQLLLINPALDAKWKVKLFAPLYNISNITPKENFADVIVTTNLNKKDYCYIVDSDAYYIDFRINQFLTQDFAANMTSYSALHLWIRSGLLLKANGVKFQISDK